MTEKQIANKAKELTELTTPLAREVRKLHESIKATKEAVKKWQKDLDAAGLRYVDYSKLLGVSVTSKHFLEMLEDRLERPNTWAKAALEHS